MIQLKMGQKITLPIRRLGINGEGIGYYQKQVVFVDGAIPGEEVVAQITEVEKNFARAKIARWLKRSPYRIKPACSIYERCGGCQLQHIHPRFQARLKRELIEEAFAKYAGLKDLPIEKTVRMQNPWGYRNKAQLPLQKQGSRVVMGMFAPGTHQLIPIEECGVQHPILDQVLNQTRQIIEKLKIPIYDEKKETGILRHVVARIAFATEEVQLIFVSKEFAFPQEHQLVNEVVKSIPNVKSIYVNVNPERTSLVMGEKSRLIWGERKIREKLGDLTFLLSPRAFFQLNPKQTEVLYEEVRKAAELSGDEVVIDAYCGVGTIGLWLARSAKKVYGMDTIPEAIGDARENAQINGISNVEYVVGPAEEWVPHWVEQGIRPDVVVADPPRTGLGDPLVELLMKVPVSRLIYVSCNPATLAKDCSHLLQAGYRLERVVPVDLFPHTAHIEAVCRLVYQPK